MRVEEMSTAEFSAHVRPLPEQGAGPGEAAVPVATWHRWYEQGQACRPALPGQAR